MAKMVTKKCFYHVSRQFQARFSVFKHYSSGLSFSEAYNDHSEVRIELPDMIGSNAMSNLRNSRGLIIKSTF